MKHRFTHSEFGRHCFRCGRFDHAIESDECSARFFANVTEAELTEAEDWVAKPHTEERNIFAVKAYLAGRGSVRS